MSAAVRIELDDAQLDDLAERIAKKLRAPRPRVRPAQPEQRKATADEIERMARRLRQKGKR